MSCWSWFLLYIFPIYGLISCDRQNCDILTEILSNGVTSHVYSGAVAMVGNEKGLLYSQAVGYYSYDTNDKPVNIFSSIFDIASLTKVISTTSAVAHLYQAGLLSPDDYVVNILGENYGQHNKHLIQIKHCLLHNAGYSPDPIPWYWDQEFPCPNTDDEYPAEDFSCIYPFIYNSFINETLNTLPGEAYVYSDLSFLTLQYVVGMIVLKNHLISRNDYRDECIQWIDAHNIVEILSPLDLICAYEAYVRREVFGYHFIDILPHTTTTTTSGNRYSIDIISW